MRSNSNPVLTVNILGRDVPPSTRRFLNLWTSQVFSELRRRRVFIEGEAPELTIALLGEIRARKLNLQYRQKDYATDVLSFADGTGLGDLVICMPVIKRQAKEHQLSLNEELGYMVLHGILHLIGYDHEKSDKEARAMYRLQDAIFAQLRGGIHGHSHRTQRRQKSTASHRRKSR